MGVCVEECVCMGVCVEECVCMGVCVLCVCMCVNIVCVCVHKTNGGSGSRWILSQNIRIVCACVCSGTLAGDQ